MRTGNFIAGVVVGGVLGFVLHAWLPGNASGGPVPPRDGSGAIDPAEPAALLSPAGGALAPEPVESLAAPPAPPATELVASAHDVRLGILVYGAVTDPEGGPVTFESWNALAFDDGGTRKHEVRLDPGATYAASGLTPGRWRVAIDLDGFRPFRSTVELDASRPAQRFDIELEPAVLLDVKGFTPSGERLLDAVSETLANGERWHDLRLTAIATREPPPPVLPEISTRAYSRWGVGSYRDVFERLPFVGNDLPPDVMGRLELDVSLPVHVSLVFRHIVLQTQLVDPGATEVVFVIPVGTLEALLGVVRARVVSATTGAPIETARASLSDSQSSGITVEPGADGILEWTRQRPGLQELTIRAEGHETLHGEVSVPSGGVAHLGTIEMSPSTTVSGIVLDPDGEPVAASLRMLMESPIGGHGMGARTSFRSDGTGHFERGGFGRRIYYLWATSDDWVAVPVRVDLRGGDFENVVVRMVSGTQVRLLTEWSPEETYRIVVTSEEGFVVSRSVLWSPTWTWSKRLVPGRYEVAIWSGDREIHRVSLVAEGPEVVLDVSP